MPSPSDSTAQQKNPAASSARPPRERVLPVAQIYSVKGAELHGSTQSMVTLIIGDERTAPKHHGIRASRSDWLALIAALCREDEQLALQARADLREQLGA